MLQKLKNKITERQTLNGNKCGITMPYLMHELGISLEEISTLLNQLYKEKFIVIRKGINNQLIFLKNGK
jgi:transcription initiation factor IIE alpha subunit